MATSGSKSVTVTSWDTLKFSWSRSSYSITNNTSTITWKLELIAGSSGRISSSASKAWSVTVNGTKYSGTNTIGISNNTTKTLASGTTTIKHNDDGTKTFSYSFSQEFSITFSGTSIGTKSGSGSGTLDTIPRKSTLTASNGTLNTEQTLTVTRQSSSFTHTITYTCGSASGTIVTKSSSTSIKFTPPLSLASQNTTGTSVSVKFTITTYNGSTSLGSNTKTITCSIPSSVKPSCKISVSDASGYSVYLKGLSKFKITVTPTTSYGSAIASYSVKADGGTYTTATVTTPHIVSHGSQTITATVTDKRGRTGTASVTVSVYTISGLSVGNGTLGTAQTLTINRETNKFTHNLTYNCGGTIGTVASGTSDTSVSFTPPLSLSSKNTTGTSVSITYTLTTLCDGKNIGSVSKTVTCTIPSSIKPSCSIGVSDPEGHFSTYGAYVKGLSKFAVTITPTLAYNSAIATYSAKANGVTYANASFTTGLVTSSGSLNITATVTDKRGRTSDTVTKSVTVLNYALPELSKLTAVRCNQDGTPNNKGGHIKITFDSKVTPLNDKNSATYIVEYKKSSESSYTSKTLDSLNNVYTTSGASFIFEADINSSYNVTLTVKDDIDEGTGTIDISTGFTTIHYKKGGKGVGIGKVAELDDVLDIGFRTRFYGGILHPVLKADTDLDDVRTPNTYVGENVTSNDYLNCPITDGTFTLVVEGAGGYGQVKQTLTVCNKTDSRVFERFYYGDTWGEWFCTYATKNKILWSGESHMNSEHYCELSEPISRQPNGVVLVFTPYTGDGVQNHNFNTFFISKYEVLAHPGSGHAFPLYRSYFNDPGNKYIYINDSKLTGYSGNVSANTNNGITYDSSKWCLRYVIGV